MSKNSRKEGVDIYYNKSKIKWVVLGFSIVISIASVFYTDMLVKQLKNRERKQIELFAKALEYTANESMNNNVYFITEKILFDNNSIPRILVRENGEIIGHMNIELDSSLSQPQMKQQLYQELEQMRENYEPISVELRDDTTKKIYEIQYVYYKNSFLLTQLIYYPYIQLSVIAIFGFISYMVFNYSKTAEQNRVWVGLAKETAHQLGTPISSLMAWVEYFKDQASEVNKPLIGELDKDIKKLQVITERFSNIGSAPVLSEEDVEIIIRNTIEYLKPRISPKVKMTVEAEGDELLAIVNPPLFEWVIENLCKNAVDAMTGSGAIKINIKKTSDYKILIDVTDTGKGIPKSKIKQIFNPGYTSKKRGWGLGLTLAKRIIDVYHQGKIFVKWSEENEGTTFRIILRADS